MRANDPTPRIASPQADEEIRNALLRIRRAILGSAIDCHCRDRVDAALRHVEQEERARIAERLLAAACKQRRQIEALLLLLSDFNPDDGRPDDGMIAEASLLFGDIAAAAELGANLLRQARQFRFAPEARENSDSAAAPHRSTEADGSKA